ncbi:paramyosin-like isoform X2 [Hydractinia symbiolongicarpus]|uniref:paramyosin-like isoform X2 n=1 Tax=Hydractinia symbiolongicarpus TaxID=13093 RepID=UPI002550D435|nr:paramyosin-like isoform X2 [Hydractinia symbiolongicarpus]
MCLPRQSSNATCSLGISQITIGVMLLTIGVGALIVLRDYYLLCGGMWAGVWILVTGVVGVISSRELLDNAALAKIYSVLNLASSCFGIMNLIFFGVGLKEVELKSKLEKLEESLNSMVSVRNEVNNKNKNLQSLVDELRERDVTWTTENSGLKSKLVFEQHCIKEIKSQLEKEQVKKESLKIKNKKLCESLKTLEMRYGTVEAQRKEIHEMNESLQNGNIKLVAQCKFMEINLAKLSNENADLKEELKKREEEVRAFVEDENNIEIYLKERYTAFTSLQVYYAKLEVAKNEVEKERDKLKKDIEILSKSKENAEKGNQGLEEKLSQCQFLFIENDEKYAAIMERVNTLMKQNITYEKTIKQMNEQINELKHNCQEHVYNEEKLRSELIQTTQRLEKSFDENEEIRAKLTESLRKITLTMEEEESRLRDEYKKKDVKIEHLSRKVKECEEIIEANKTQMFNSNERVNLLSAKVECLTAEILKLKQEQEQLVQQIETFRHCESAWQNDATSNLSRIGKLEKMLDERDKTMALYREEVELLERLCKEDQMQAIKELQEELNRDHSIQDTSSLWNEL